jgi:hypothetical protein
MADVFISYSNKDRSPAEHLALTLTSKGLGVWWDNKLIGDEKFLEAIDRQLAAAKVVVVLWSANAVVSRLVIDVADQPLRGASLCLFYSTGSRQNSARLASVDSRRCRSMTRRAWSALQRRGLTIAPKVEVKVRTDVGRVLHRDLQLPQQDPREAIAHLGSSSGRRGTRGAMTDIFISFKTDDTARVQPIFDGFLSRGLTVFWSNDIPKGAPNYQAILKDEILKAPVVVVVWTKASVHSGPVVQECSQAERANKLFQVLLDDIEPIDMPMEVRYKSQKTMLLDWTGDQRDPEWVKLNAAIDARLGRRAEGRN